MDKRHLTLSTCRQQHFLCRRMIHLTVSMRRNTSYRSSWRVKAKLRESSWQPWTVCKSSSLMDTSRGTFPTRRILVNSLSIESYRPSVTASWGRKPTKAFSYKSSKHFLPLSHPKMSRFTKEQCCRFVPFARIIFFYHQVLHFRLFAHVTTFICPAKI